MNRIKPTWIELDEFESRYPQNVIFDDVLGMNVIDEDACECAYLAPIHDVENVNSLGEVEVTSSYRCTTCGKIFGHDEVKYGSSRWDSSTHTSHYGVSKADVEDEIRGDKVDDKEDPPSTQVTPQEAHFWGYKNPRTGSHHGIIWLAIRYGPKLARKKANQAYENGLLTEGEIEWLKEMLKDDISMPWWTKNILRKTWKSSEERSKWMGITNSYLERLPRRLMVKYHGSFHLDPGNDCDVTPGIGYINNVVKRTYIGEYVRKGVKVSGHYRRVTKKSLISSKKNLAKARLTGKKMAFMDLYPETDSLKEGFIQVWDSKSCHFRRMDSFNVMNLFNRLKERALEKGFEVKHRDVPSLCLERFGKTPLYSRARSVNNYKSLAKNLSLLV